MNELDDAAKAIYYLSNNYTGDELAAVILGLASALDLPESERQYARELRAEWVERFLKDHIKKVKQ